MITMIIVQISRKECNEQCNQMWKEKKAWMYVNDILLKYCKFCIGHSVEHRVESIQIFIKATWFITSCQSQSETENKAWTSTVLNFVSYLAQTCVGSSQRSYVNSIHLLVQLLQAGYFHTWPWLDETVFLKACLVQPHNPRNGNFDRQYFDNI